MVEIKTIDNRTMYINTNYIVSIEKSTYSNSKIKDDAMEYARNNAKENDLEENLYYRYLDEHALIKYIVQMAVGSTFSVNEETKNLLINYN